MKRLPLLLIPFVLLTLVSCGNARYTSSGTKLSDIREFAFLKPCAYMVLYDTDGRSLSETNINIATDLITSIINSERFPFTEVMEADYLGEDQDAMDWAWNLTNVKDKKQVDRMRIPKSILNRLDGVDNRYGVFIYSLGYTTTVDAYNKERLSKAASKVIDAAAEELTGIAGLTNPSQIYTPNDPYGNEMICVVIDKQEQRIIYFNKQNPTFASHPKDDGDVNKLLHKLLRDFIR
jgi:hypothetical protein